MKRSMIALGLAGLLAAGCTAAPTTPPGGPSPGQTGTATASPGVATPTPVRIVIAAVADLDLRCSTDDAYTPGALDRLSLAVTHQPPAVVPLGDGWGVLAFWKFATGGNPVASGVVLHNGVASEVLPEGWDGTVPAWNAVLEDGPKALAAALICLEQVAKPADQPEPEFVCRTPERDDLLRVQKAVWGGGDGNPTGGGVYVEGGTTPEGKPWRIGVMRTDTERGWATVLVTLPSPLFRDGQAGRSEFSPISERWDGELAEFRGTVQWGVEGLDAAVGCLALLSSGSGGVALGDR